MPLAFSTSVLQLDFLLISPRPLGLLEVAHADAGNEFEDVLDPLIDLFDLGCGVDARFLCLYGGFGDGPANAANRILPRLTLVLMEVKFGTKCVTVRTTLELGYYSLY